MIRTQRVVFTIVGIVAFLITFTLVALHSLYRPQNRVREIVTAHDKPTVKIDFVLPGPEAVVFNLYQQVVARRPLGIPKGDDNVAIRPFLSKELNQKLDVAQACEDDYFRKHTSRDEKPDFGWLETGLFSGPNEKSIPSAASVERSEPQKDGSFIVYVNLTYRESFETYGRPSNPENTFNWPVAANVVLQGGQPLIDDVLFFKDDSTKIDSRLTDSFRGCKGSHWVGDTN